MTTAPSGPTAPDESSEPPDRGAELGPRIGLGTGRALWLLRHGEVEARWHGRSYGCLDVSLSPEGEATTAARAASFGAQPWGAIASSDLVRARALGEAIAARAGVELGIDRRLREIDRGRWQGSLVSDLREEYPDDIAEFYSDPWSFRGHGGESDAMVFARVEPALLELLDRAPAADAHAPVLATCHFNVIRVFVARALGVPPERSFGLRVDPGRAVMLRDTPKGFVLGHSNVTSPLASPARHAPGGSQ